MERSTIHLLAKRGKSRRGIARELRISRVTVARALEEPVNRTSAPRARASMVDPYRPQIEQWLIDGLSIVRMLELVRADPEHPFTGGRSTFSDMVRRIRREIERTQADVPVRFEGLPGEYLQVDWGEIRRFPFTQQSRVTRYFLACRLKHSRWTWVRWTGDIRQETLLRGLVACFALLGWVPWVLVFDNMATVTSGRDGSNEPIWTPALRQLAAEFGFHPQACAPAAGNQKGSVESLVKWVKGNFLPGRSFADDGDLAQQNDDWLAAANTRPSDASGEPPVALLPQEAAKGGLLPPTAHDYGVLRTARVTRESVVHVLGNRYSVPVEHVGLSLTVRVHQERIVLWRDAVLVAEHRREADGGRRRVVDPAHFAPLFATKPRARVMLYREALLALDPVARDYVAELSCRRRDRLGPEVLGIHALLEQYGETALLDVMRQTAAQGAYGLEYLASLLHPSAPLVPEQALPPLLVLPDVPAQQEVDRDLALYETIVTGGGSRATW